MLDVMDKAMWRFSCLCHCRTQLLDIGTMISSVTNEGRCLSISRGCLAPTASTIDLVTLYQLSLLKLWLETPSRFYFNKGLLKIAHWIRKGDFISDLKENHYKAHFTNGIYYYHYYSSQLKCALHTYQKCSKKLWTLQLKGKLRKGALIFPLMRVNKFMRKTEVRQKSSISTQMRDLCKLL